MYKSRTAKAERLTLFFKGEKFVTYMVLSLHIMGNS